jgi:hypothetical protein
VSSKFEADIILDLVGIENYFGPENFTLIRCDEEYDCEDCKPQEKEGKLIWKQVPLEIPCKPTRFRVKELNEDTTIPPVELNDLENDIRYKLKRPETNSIVLVESKQSNTCDPHCDPHELETNQTIGFLPSNCAKEHECLIMRKRKKPEPIAAIENKCIVVNKKGKGTELYKFSVRPKLGRKVGKESGEIDIDPSEKEVDRIDGQPHQWLKRNQLTQAENERVCSITDPCVLPVESDTNATGHLPTDQTVLKKLMIVQVVLVTLLLIILFPEFLKLVYPTKFSAPEGVGIEEGVMTFTWLPAEMKHWVAKYFRISCSGFVNVVLFILLIIGIFLA